MPCSDGKGIEEDKKSEKKDKNPNKIGIAGTSLLERRGSRFLKHLREILDVGECLDIRNEAHGSI